MGCRDIMRGLMTCTDFGGQAQKWARRLEDGETRRSGAPLPAAREAVARRLGVTPGTLENLRNGRIKQVAAFVFERLRAVVETEIAAEINALEHELQVARATGLDPRSVEMAEVETALAKAREILRRGA